MKDNAALRAVLNRQQVVLGSGFSLDQSSFGCGRSVGIGTSQPAITFKPFERVYPLNKETQSFSA